MAVAYPITLPILPLAQGFQKQREDNRLAFQPEIGPPKRRRRTFMSMYLMPMTIQMTTSELAIFEAWYDDDLSEGTYQFTFTDPITEVVTRHTFETSYTIEDTRTFDDDESVWNVSFTLRVMP